MARTLAISAFFYVVLQGWHLTWYTAGAFWEGPQAFAAPFGPKYASEWGWVLVHGVSAGLVLLLGPWLLLRPDWKGSRVWHGTVGKIYLLSVLVGGVSAFPMCVRAEGGAWGQAGFLVLNCLWLAVAWPLYRTARARRWKEHRVWVRFHYLLTCAALVIRLGLASGDRWGWNPDSVSAGVPWFSMVPARVYAAVVGLPPWRGQGWSTSPRSGE